MPENRKKRTSRTIRFLPLEGSSLFALNRPFKAVLKDTSDPRIKKIHMEADASGISGEDTIVNTVVTKELLDRLKQEAVANHQSISARIETILEDHFAHGPRSTEGDSAPPAGESPTDFIIFNIIEAADLILDGASPRQKEETFRVFQHALKILLSIKKTEGGRITENARKKLMKVLDDLGRLKMIAEQEERNRRLHG